MPNMDLKVYGQEILSNLKILCIFENLLLFLRTKKEIYGEDTEAEPPTSPPK